MSLAPVGRVAIVVGGLPVVVPVNFALLGEDVIFRTGTGSKLVSAIDRDAVSFEVDSADVQTHSGWSVLITGPATEMTRPGERALGSTLGLRAWVRGREHIVRIRSDIVTGRRLSPEAGADAVPETDWDWG